MRSRIIIFSAFLALWLLLSDYWTPLLLSLGFASAIGTMFLIARMQAIEPWPPAHRPIFYLRMAVHYVRLIGEMFIEAMRVARLIFMRRCQPNMAFVNIPITAQTPLAQLVRANSITLTPGTISADFENGRIDMHVLDIDGYQYAQQQAIDEQVHRIEQ